MTAFQRYSTILRHTSFKNTKPQIRRYKHAFHHANLKPLKAKNLTHANAFSFPKSTSVYKTTPSFIWTWKAPIFHPPLLGATPRILKRYPEPVAHGPEAQKPMARRPGRRHTRTDAVNTVRQRDIPFL